MQTHGNAIAAELGTRGTLVGLDFSRALALPPEASRIEMHLQAQRALTVRWPSGERRFAEGERIHTENSYKYGVDGFESLLRRAGYAQVRRWTNERQGFAAFAAT